ncbi:MAG: 5-(carboxyamino)imidazole ribonucleotide synthase [Bacteroidetes bacterium]|nr:5-(carboxyamino)imidazole ribonucleotide synthase [Bacteroidota bacterium]
MPNPNNSIPTLGILGGGQLGRMLIQEALNWNIQVHVLDPDKNCPCADIASKFVCGDFRDYETVIEFCKGLDFITIEIEQVNTEALLKLSSEGAQVFPQPELVDMIKDKGLQKQFYTENAIPTSDFRLLNSREELEQLSDDFFPCFQKTRRDGYDGKGVQFLSGRGDISKGFDSPSLVEKAVSIQMEFALIGVGNGLGECSIFPPVEMEFHPGENLVEYLIVPAELTDSQLHEAGTIVRRIFKATQLRGLLAVEFFLSAEGRILVNEMAPRPHNSGHTTIEGNFSSQFAEHLRAVLGWPAGDTSLRCASVMINLLGAEGHSGKAVYEGLSDVLAAPGVYVHLYGKYVTKPYRKMGHITVLGSNRQEARDKADLIRNSIKIVT